MSAQTKIEWCDRTHNEWIGCTKVSPACDHCYAEINTASRALKVKWGPKQPRHRTAMSNRAKPIHWNKETFWECKDCGFRGTPKNFDKLHRSCESTQFTVTRQRVFASSLSDWLDNEVPIEWLVSLLDTIRKTPNLDWLLLTKRIGNWRSRIEEARNSGHCNVALMNWLHDWLSGSAPNNVWIGATVVNQAEANRDIDKLLRVPAVIRFLSIEPMLGPIDLTCIKPTIFAARANALTGRWAWDGGPTRTESPPIDWVICGGESGPRARPSHPDWYRSLRDQCAAAGVPFLFKQWGEWLPWTQFKNAGIDDGLESTRYLTAEWDNDDWRDVGRPIWSDFADGHIDDEQCVGRVGKARAGRLLDGREHNGFPTLRIAA